MPTFEEQRIAALHHQNILDTLPEQIFDDIVLLAAKICGTPVSLISFVDETRQWFKARVGLDATETPRHVAFCDYSIRQDRVFEIHDAREHPLFEKNPLVTGDPNIRFYAGAVLKDSQGLPLGTLCVLDYKPNELSPDQRESLEALGRQVMANLELRLLAQKLERAEQRARESEAKVSAHTKTIEDFVEDAPVAMAILDGPGHRFIRVNGLYSMLVGDRVLDGLTIREAFPELTNQPFYQILDDVYTSGQSLRASNVPVKLKDGEIFINMTYAPRFSPEGHIQGIGVFCVDVTDQRKAENELIEKENFLRLLMDSLPANIAYVDAELRIKFANKSVRDVFGLTETELAGMPLSKMFKPEHMAQRLEPYKKALAGEPQTIKVNSFDKNGDLLVTMNTVIPDRSAAGSIEGFFAIAYDLTREEQLLRDLEAAKNKAESANVTKSAFLANMSHEIRSPLGAIMGFAALAQETAEKSDELLTYLKIIEKNSSQVLRIVDDILDLSKVEAGKIQIETFDFSLIELLSDFASISAFKAHENGVTFVMKATTPIPDSVLSDHTRLKQILHNVVGNALKFTKKGSVTLSVSYLDGKIRFHVQDTGIGISALEAEQLFQAFNQADVSTTRKFGGTGLGLVLAKNLAQALGGDFWLESSKIGQGSVFIAEVQVQLSSTAVMVSDVNYNQQTLPFALPALDGKEFSDRNILLVDDSPDNLLLIGRILKKVGCIVKTASDGLLGVEEALNSPYDLILMDIQMPNMDGYNAVQTLRRNGVTTPIVAITAHAMKDERENCMVAGFNDYVAKPINRERLIETMRTLLMKKG